jgi:hypothetical protein
MYEFGIIKEIVANIFYIKILSPTNNKRNSLFYSIYSKKEKN